LFFLTRLWEYTNGLAGLSGISLGKLMKYSRATGATISVLSSFVLTFGFGYLGYWFINPVGPAQKHGWEALLDLPNPSPADLTNMFPIHLGITAILCALITSRLWYSWSPDLNIFSKGRAIDNVMIEPQWRTVKYEDIYLQEYTNGTDPHKGLRTYFHHYSSVRKHTSLGRQTPAEVYRSGRLKRDVPSI
jgi:hypothetical protein